jgi:hypothetical protein
MFGLFDRIAVGVESIGVPEVTPMRFILCFVLPAALAKHRSPTAPTDARNPCEGADHHEA